MDMGSLSEPTTAGIDTTHTSSILAGCVGVTTHGGSGYRYWSPIAVISNETYEGAFIAYEDLAADTIADIKPFLPYNWQDMEFVERFPVGIDTSGFTFEQMNQAFTVVYRHEPGKSPSGSRRSRIMPQTNLSWTNYKFTGTIIKPDSATYDSIPVAAL
jgi:hypothetical protein